MEDEKEDLVQRIRNAEQYSFEFLQEAPPPRTQPPKTYAEEKPCGNLGYCYCPKCHPK